MRCKECREKISDNVKYCPECGALLNANITYNIRPANNYPPVVSAPNNEAHSEEPTYMPKIPSKGNFSGLRPASFIAVGVIFVVFALAFAFTAFEDSLFSEPDYDIFEDSIYLNSDFEYIASDYINNIVDCDAYQNVDTFNNSTAIDWEYMYTNLCNSEESQMTVVFDDDFYADDYSYPAGYQLLNDEFYSLCEQLNSQYPEDFTPYYFYCNTVSTYELSYDEQQHYLTLISDYMEKAGLDINDYIYLSEISNMYQVEISVTAENYECSDTYELDTFTVIVAQMGDYCEVLYDTECIDSLLASVSAQGEDNTEQINVIF